MRKILSLSLSFSVALLLVFSASPSLGQAPSGQFTGDAVDVKPHAPTIMRALLVGVDRFAGHPNTAPAAENNLERLAGVLRHDKRGYYFIKRSLNQRLDAGSFLRLVQDSFLGARENDFSLFYISTHGLYEEGAAPMSFRMVLSDGEQDYELSASELHAALKDVPGFKFIIVDTCNSGALIDRGMPGDGLASLFLDGSFHVLTAAGGSEPSFLWTSGQGRVEGGSYFADAIHAGLSPSGAFAADLNRDGQVELEELHRYLLDFYGVSTPQVYPRQDSTVIFSYHQMLDRGSPRLITQPVFDSDVFTWGKDGISFAFTLQRRSRVAYRLIYHRENAWRFQDAQVIVDSELDTGESLPGRKQRSLLIQPGGPDMSGYVLMFLTTVEEDSSLPHAQKLLMVEPGEGEPALRVETPSSFLPGKGEELPVFVSHGFPLRLSVRILDETGRPVAALAQQQPSRPQSLPGGGSLFYWTGNNDTGELVPQGNYRVEVTSKIGEDYYRALSAAFERR